MIEFGPAEEVTRLLPLVRSLYEEKWRTRPLTDPADAAFLPDTRNGRVIERAALPTRLDGMTIVAVNGRDRFRMSIVGTPQKINHSEDDIRAALRRAC